MDRHAFKRRAEDDDGIGTGWVAAIDVFIRLFDAAL
jgi:hypothetical protein